MSALVLNAFAHAAPPSPRFVAPGPNVLPVGLIAGTGSVPSIFYADNPASEACATISYLTYTLIDPSLQALIRTRLDNVICAHSPLSGGSIMRECMEFSEHGEFLPLHMTPHSVKLREKDAHISGRAHPSLKTVEVYTTTNKIDLEQSHTADYKAGTDILFGDPNTTEESRKHTPVLDTNYTDSMLYGAFKLSSSMNRMYETTLLLKQFLRPELRDIPSSMTHEIGHMIADNVSEMAMQPNLKYVFINALMTEIDCLKKQKYKGLDYFTNLHEAMAELIGNALLIRAREEARKNGINLPDLTTTPLHYEMPKSFSFINDSLDRYCAQYKPQTPHKSSWIDRAAPAI